MKKIIHLSDLHLCTRTNNQRFKQLASQLRTACPNPEEYVVLITGDLLDKGKTEGVFQIAKQLIDHELVDPGYQTLIVPGNHDYGTGVHNSEAVAANFKKVFYGDPNAAFPRRDIVSGAGGDIAFIGLDSNAQEFGPFAGLGADGEVGEQQRNDLATILANEVNGAQKVVVYLHHNPLVRGGLMRLDDAEQLKLVLQGAGNVDALLFGHNHSGKNACGSWGIERFYDGGTATGHHDGTTRHRLMDLTQQPFFDVDLDLLADPNGAE